MGGGPPPLAADAAVVVGSHLHLHERDGKLVAFPMVPVDALAVSGFSVFAVEVGSVAVLIPPGSFVGQGAVGDGDVVISVFGGEGSALVITQRITCCAVVFSYPQLVEVLGVSDGESVVVGVNRFLAVSHVDAELVTTLS